MKAIVFVTLSLCTLSCSTQKDSRSSQKIRILYEALAEYNKRQALDNLTKVKEIHQAIQRNREHGNGGLQILEKTDSIYSQTERMLADLRGIRVEIGASGKISGDDVTNIMLGETRDGLAYSLLKKIEDYSKAIQLIDSAQQQLVLLPQAVNIHKMDTEVMRFYFAEASAGEAFASLSQIESKVLAFEKEALLQQYMKIGCDGNIHYSTIGAFASAESNVLTPGSIYRAELFFVKILKPDQLQMEANGRHLPVNDSGHGQVSFRVGDQGLNYRDSILRRWTGLIRMKLDGRDTVFKVLVPYTVIRPTPQRLN